MQGRAERPGAAHGTGARVMARRYYIVRDRLGYLLTSVNPESPDNTWDGDSWIGHYDFRFCAKAFEGLTRLVLQPGEYIHFDPRAAILAGWDAEEAE